MKWGTLGTGVARRAPVRKTAKGRQAEEIRVAKKPTNQQQQQETKPHQNKKKTVAITCRIVAILEM